MISLSPQDCSTLVSLTLGHVTREYPHSESIRLDSQADLATPRVHHPVFFGSYDWHSCVHSYWLLARALGQFPELPEANAIVTLFDRQLTAENVAGELAYFTAPGRGGFERPYGWVWLLQLNLALHRLEHSRAMVWTDSLQPLADEIASRLAVYLPKLSYPIRSGAHNNTAFALLLAFDYAAHFRHTPLQELIGARARQFFAQDRDCQAWEPGGEDFLSPAWQEALLMQRVLGGDQFVKWFGGFLPDLIQGRPANLLEPALVSDRSDGRLAHLDGLNLSRAWCLKQLAGSFAANDPRHSLLSAAAARHLQAGRAHLQDDYMGEHWLATFLVLALEA
ncbi:MAG TPA: DUF2891 domain-containing protein [Pseudomonas xinjiangensis]|uniref:DUF2891 domain-containing protein n=2 Tax=root TaxID=1 RepID=A0A7V1FRY6_9GAMM|nr:DUF2891 domain-containing protein [Halopseudomonas xinjiangensis]HEC48563.1 DUF2891 domain-containing protein [Halopseudomonas xinjiangensis]